MSVISKIVLIFLFSTFTLESSLFSQFSSPHYFANDDFNRSVLTHDFDNDGDLDILEASAGYVDSSQFGFTKFSIIENLNNGNFLKSNVFYSLSNEFNGWEPKFIAKTDFDDDGLMDFVAYNENKDSLYLFKNSGNLSFQHDSSLGFNSGSTVSMLNLYVLDFDGDGDEDIFAQFSALIHSVWFEKTNSNTYLHHQLPSGWADNLDADQFIDFDNDGDLDLFQQINSPIQNKWSENQGNGVFSTQMTLNYAFIDDLTNSGANPRLLADLDGDGLVDVIARKTGGYLSWWKNYGSGNFNFQSDLRPSYNSYCSTIIEDFDNDGDNDLLVRVSPTGIQNGYTLEVWENNGFGAFTLSNNANIPIQYNDYILGIDRVFDDFTGDGKKDLLFLTEFDVSVYENQLGLIYSDRIEVSEKPIQSNRLFCADMDGDGDMDVVTNSRYYDEIVWVENSPSHDFLEQHLIADSVSSIAIGVINNKIIAADINGDGMNDVVSVEEYFAQGILFFNIVYYKNLVGSFSEKISLFDSITNFSSFFINDVDSDGDVDVLVGGNGFLDIYFNNGSGLFSLNQSILSTTETATYVHFIDYNNDGLVDLFFGDNSNYNTSFVKNIGGGNFGPEKVINFTYWIDQHSMGLEFMDVDLDGDIDIITGGQIVNTIDSKLYWIENISNDSFVVATQVYTALNYGFNSFRLMDLNGDNHKDIVAIINGNPFVDDSEIGFFNPSTHTFDFIPGLVEFPYANIPNETEAIADINQDGYLDIVKPGLLWASYLNFATLNLDEIQVNRQIKIFPNPTKDYLTIDSKYNYRDVKIIDFIGRQMSFVTLNDGRIDVSNLASGQYFLLFTDIENGRIAESFIVHK